MNESEKLQEIEELIIGYSQHNTEGVFLLTDLAKPFLQWHQHQQPAKLTEEQVEQEAKKAATNAMGDPDAHTQDWECYFEGYKAALTKHAVPAPVEDAIKALEMCVVELKAAYKRLGYHNSNVMDNAERIVAQYLTPQPKRNEQE